MAKDILDDEGMKGLVEEFGKVEGEEAVAPEATLVSPEKDSAPDPDEPSREMPETDETKKVEEVAEEATEEQDIEPVDDLTQQLTDLADIFGMPPEVLVGKFSSVDDAKAAISLLDQSYASAPEAQPEEYDDYPEEEEYQQPEKKRRKPAAKPSAPTDMDWSELSLDDWDDDDTLPKNLKGIDKNTRILQEQVMRMQDVLMQLHEKDQTTVYGDTMERLNSIVDREESKLFGSGDELTPTQEKNRMQLFQHADYLVAGMHARGAELPTEEKLIERALQLAFKTELGKERALGRASGRRPRDSRRLGVPSRGTDKSVTDMAMQHSGPLEENKAFLELYKRLDDES